MDIVNSVGANFLSTFGVDVLALVVCLIMLRMENRTWTPTK